MITRNFNLYLNAGHSIPLVINANQAEEGEQWVFSLFQEDGTPYIPTDGSIVGIKSDGYLINNSGTVVDGKVVIAETRQMTAAAGKSVFELRIDGLTHGTANFIVLVEKDPTNGGIVSDSDLSLIEEALSAVSPLPTGGTVGQVLTKTANGSAWSDAGTPTQEQVAEAVSDWASEHISVETGVVIDTSLAVAGAAADSAKVGQELSDLKRELDNIVSIQEPINLFDKTSQDIISGHYYTKAGAYVEDANYFLSHKIPVSPGEIYSVSATAYIGKASAAFFGADDTFVVSGYNTTVLASGDSFTSATVTVPQNSSIKYMRVAYRQSRINRDMIVKGSTYPSEYTPYTPTQYTLDNDVKFNTSQLQTINPLWGKKVAFNGDSICFGAGYSGGYAAMIGARNNMTVENRAVSGATIAAGTYTSGGVAKHWICRDISNMAADADYIILEGGVNDSETMGSFGRSYSAESYNDTEYTAAFESMIVQALARWPGKKIGYIAVHGCYRLWSNVRAKLNSDPEGSYYQRAIDICEKWGIPVCDLNKEVPPFGLLPEGNALRTQYTNNGDGWHPTANGYADYYVPKIEAWMKTL